MKWLGIFLGVSALLATGIGVGVSVGHSRDSGTTEVNEPPADVPEIAVNPDRDPLAEQLAREFYNGIEPSADTVTEMHSRLEQIRSNWIGSTDLQIDQSIDIVFGARTYWPNMTMLDCIEYLINEPSHKLQVVAGAAAYVGTTTTFGSNQIQQDTLAAGGFAGSAGIAGGSIVTAAREIYSWLESEYHRPELEAQLQHQSAEALRQELIQQNIGTMRERGALENQKRDENFRRANELPDWAQREVIEGTRENERRITSGRFRNP